MKKTQASQPVQQQEVIEEQHDDEVMHDHEPVPEESAHDSPKGEDPDNFEEQYRQILVQQLENEAKLVKQQKEMARRQFEEIASNVKQLQDRWKKQDEPIPEQQITNYNSFIEKYKDLRQTKSKRTLLGEAIYKSHYGYM